MSLASNALCSLDELKSFMGIELADTSKDTVLEIYINSTSNMIEKLIGRNIFAADYTEQYRGVDSNELILKHYPINAITSVSYVDNGVVYFTLDENCYTVEVESGILYRNEGWIKTGYSSFMSGKINFPRQHIKIVYNAGYIEVPADLKLVCMQLCSDNYTFDNSEAGKLKSYSISDVKMDFVEEIKMSAIQAKVINSYRSVKF